MGRLIEGKWVNEKHDPRYVAGRYERAQTQFRDWITADGRSRFPAEGGRYHLYVSHACPWAHRTIIVRLLKGLTDAIGVSYVAPLMLENGWELPEGADPVNQFRYMYQVYAAAKPDYTGQASVPVLWDKVSRTIVSNESSEIIRMLNGAFDAIGDSSVDLYPASLRPAIDEINAIVYENVNNGVYKTGFSRTQEAYEESFGRLFDTLDALEERLSQQRYLVGNRPTEADWRLFTTLIRFDAVYFGHFKCNLKRIADYPQLDNYVRDLYQIPGIAETVVIDEIKTHYYASHRHVNPTGIVPKGPALDFSRLHNRDRFDG